MTRDQAVYGSDADAFRPDRFLEGDLRDPRKIVFGFGRRYVFNHHLAQHLRGNFRPPLLQDLPGKVYGRK